MRNISRESPRHLQSAQVRSDGVRVLCLALYCNRFTINRLCGRWSSRSIACNINAIAGEASGESCILTLAADRQREGVLRDGDDCSLRRFVNHNRDHRCWREGATDHLGGIIRKGDDVHLFTAKLLNHRLDARAALSNNSANRVESNLVRSDDHLAAVPWLTCNRADLNETCADLWHLKLKELLDEVLMRAR